MLHDAGNNVKYYRYEFLLLSLASSFILLYYSYELCVQVCESLCTVVVKLCHVMLKAGKYAKIQILQVRVFIGFPWL